MSQLFSSRPCVSLSLRRALGVGIGILAGAGAACGVVACGDPSPSPSEDVRTTGTGRMALEIPPGRSFAEIAYRIDGPNGYVKEGTVDVKDSTKVSLRVGGLPRGHFTITLTASTADAVPCTGSAEFQIRAGQTTSVHLKLRCQEPRRKGSVEVKGEFNTCPSLEAVSVLPSEVEVGGSIDLSAEATDSDSGPSPLGYSWATTSGTVADPSAAETTYTCTEPGTHALTVAANDGDPACDDSTTVEVTCTNPCPREDDDACTIDICEADGSTSHDPSPWEGCDEALDDVEVCPNVALGDPEFSALDGCMRDLEAALTEQEDPTELEGIWAAFDACVDESVGCGGADDATSSDAGVPSAPRDAVKEDGGARKAAAGAYRASPAGGFVCEATEYKDCRNEALGDLAVQLGICAGVAKGTAAAPPVALSAFKACAAGALVYAAWELAKCVADASCDGSQVCVNESCVNPGITVTSATYGGNCSQPTGNVTGSVAGTCNGKPSCDVFVSNSVFGDPAFGCAKDFRAEFLCSGSSIVKTASHGAVVNENYHVNLSCP